MSTAKHGDTVRVHYIGKLDDGVVFDSSRDGDPLEFTIGEETLIPAFERAVVGLTVGVSKRVVLAPDEAYGPRRDDRIVHMERSRLPSDPAPEPGMVLRGSTPDGDVALTIVEVGDDTVTLDANHPLAGKQLTFDVELVEIVSA